MLFILPSRMKKRNQKEEVQIEAILGTSECNYLFKFQIRMESMTTPARHRIKTINIKCVEQNYGKNPLSKDYMFSLRLLTFRIHSSMLSSQIQVQDQSQHKKYGKLDGKEMLSALIDDRASQSQTSSNGQMIQIHGKVIKDFKAKMHTMNQPIVLIWLYRLGIVFFLVLFGLSCNFYNHEINSVSAIT